MFDQRFFKITIAVLLFHAGLLYLIQSGLARKLTEAIVAPEIIARIIPMEQPKPEPPAPEPPKAQPTPPKQVKIVTPRPTPPKPQPTPTAVANLPPTPNAIEAPPAPPAPPAPEPPSPPPVAANSAPRAVGIGEMACSQPTPVYPRQSTRMGEKGTAKIRLSIDEKGQVIKAVVSESSGSERLDAAALAAAKEIRCKPYVENGRPVAAIAVQPIKFDLN